MAETLPPTPNEIDDMLAKFTDDVLAEATPEQLASLTEAELLELQKTVLLLNKVAGRREPTPAQSKKIWNNLATQWQKTGAVQPKSLWQRLEQKVSALQSDLLSGNRRQLYSFSAAMAVIVALIVVGSGLPNLEAPLTGAIGGGDVVIPVLVLAGAVSVGVIWWWLRRKR